MALNPIVFTEQVVSDFLRYQLTTYPLADADLYAQLRSLLRLSESRDTPLRKGPFVSLSRPFMSGATIDHLVREGVLHPGMRAVASYSSVRKHQESAIRAIREGKTTLVATGTGSGKTEAFLYPIISRCLELAESGAPPGIVAVLVYPMNALAEDQLFRLRGLLAGRGIAFGMYVGKTPEEEAGVRGERMPHGSSNGDYRTRLFQMREGGESATLLPPEERASRAAMRTKGGQPRILLTNVKQLELLLTRGKDIGLFDSAPLEFLVFDEAHTYRGAQGAETACLIRRLRSYCGKAASQVTCVATSATMADPDRGTEAAGDFARRFFGVDATKVETVGEIYDELGWNEQRQIPQGPPEDPAGVLRRLLLAVDAPDEAVADALSSCLAELGGAAIPKADWQVALTSQLASNELVYQLSELLRAPRALEDLAALLRESLGRDVSEHEILCWLALGVACGRDSHDPLLRPVVHSFIRGVGGAVVTLSNPGSSARLWLAGEDADVELGETWRRFPILTCTTCGQHYYETWVKDFRLVADKRAAPEGGDLVGTTRHWEHLSAELGGVRVIFVDRLIVQPDEDDDSDTFDEDGNIEVEAAAMPSGHDYEHGRLHPLWVCGHCGALHETASEECATCHAADSPAAVQAVRCKEDLPGVLYSCVSCQSQGRRPGGGRYREPARPVRAVSVSDVHVLAQSMLHLSERPRLLVFADNRQDAAFQAGWMRDHARRFRLRALMSQAIPDFGASIGDVAQRLDAVLEMDSELSRALIPEVWQFAPQEDAGVKHREERLYFLRLQTLREMAMGVKQRLGLEPWGRVRVEYVGLDAGHDVIAHWAERLGFEPSELAEGVAALLDHMRRIRLLHDAPTRVFGKLWRDGDKEIQYGYLPSFSGGPRGVKLSRLPSDSRDRVTQWIGSRPTQIWNAVLTWRVTELDLEDCLRDLWGMLTSLKLLVPVSLEGWGKPLTGTAGTFQVDASKLRLLPFRGRWRCEKCRRTTIRRGPTSTCLAWRCGGRLAWEENDPDDFDLHVLDGNYAMLRVAEHSAQVPAEVRERIENQFKGQGEHLNALVCTPTLELGVDIGALDAVLMRNVPPSAANYWQRAGRAGRRHRMAVDITYAQATGFDQSYFRDPLKLLSGLVEPPRFNLKNDLMVRKHVHATVLTALHGLARRSGEPERTLIEEVVGRCIPATLKSYLFTPGGEVREAVLDVGDFGRVIAQHRRNVLQEVERAFHDSWPTEDETSVRSEDLAEIVDTMANSLAEVLRRFKRRLDWARSELSRLAREESQKGVLDPEDQAHRRRCQRVIERLKGQALRTRSQAQGGSSDSDTMGALAREGFLPGYGLEAGSIVGTAEPPRMTHGLTDFELPRAPTMALREYVPGNAIYANGFRFVPRRFQLVPDETMRFLVDPESQVVQELGTDSVVAALGAKEIRAVPVCDVILPSQSQISDEEEFRFQMPVAVYALERGVHRGGTAWSWGEIDLKSRRAVHLRMVNVGPRGEVQGGSLGYHLCLACGQSHSPYASQRSRDEFIKKHEDRCAHRVKPTGFFADVEVDVLGVAGAEDATLAFSVMEALRMGAARVLDMEVEDLQIIALGRPGEKALDVLLYDPMPGGSGLLEQLVERWSEVCAAALSLVEGCAGACERSCIDCLQTYRNRFYHAHLDRHRAQLVLEKSPAVLVELHAIPEALPRTSTTAGQPQTFIEQRFKRYIAEAGLSTPTAQRNIDLGGNQSTTPDFYYEGEEESEPGIAIYLDGMSGHIHGNPEQAETDRFLRAKLRSLGYEVVEVLSFELDDEAVVVATIARIAKYLVGKERQRSVRTDTSWFSRAKTAPEPPPADSPPIQSVFTLPVGKLLQGTPAAQDRYVKCVPFVLLKAAAGQFGDPQHVQDDESEWIEIEVSHRLRKGMFVAQVVGKSMEPVIPDGAYCLFSSPVEGTRQGKNVLVQLRDGADPETGQRYTIKRYESEKEMHDSLWRHSRIVLKPANPDFEAIVLEAEDDAEVAVIAELVEVLGLGHPVRSDS